MNSWPTLTKFELANIEDPAHAFEPRRQASLVALARARKAINDAHLAIIAARRSHLDSPAISEQLAACARLVAQAHTDFPLTVMPGERRRPKGRPPVADKEALPYHWEDRNGNPVG